MSSLVALVSACALLLAVGGLLLISTPADLQTRLTRERLRGVRRTAPGAETADADSEYAIFGLGAARDFVLSHLLSAGLAPTAFTVGLTVASLGICMVAVGALFGWLAALGLFCATLMTGNVILNMLARRRNERFLDALPAFVERLRHLLSAGISFPLAFGRALTHAETDVILDETLSPIVRRIDNGMPVPEAIHIQAERLRSQELAILAVIAQANLRYGGSLAQSLDHYTHILHDRVRLKRESRALGAETRASSKVLIALPVLVTLSMIYMNPDYLRFFTENSYGYLLLIYIAGSNLAGIMVMRHLARVEY